MRKLTKFQLANVAKTAIAHEKEIRTALFPNENPDDWDFDLGLAVINTLISMEQLQVRD